MLPMQGCTNMIAMIPILSKHIVGIAITPRTITCSWISPTGRKETPYELKGYKYLLFELQQNCSLVLFNPSRLHSLISSFLTKHNLSNASIVTALSGNGLVEKQIMLLRPTAELQSLEESEKINWHYYCLQNNPGPTAAPWYCCGIPPEILLQYQLLAIRCRLNLIQITTPTMALLKAYSFLKKKQGTQEQNASDKGHSIVDYVQLNGHVKIRSAQEHATIVEGLGLFLLGKQLHEEH